MDHARTLREQLEVEVFKANAIGQAFYTKYGFILIEEKVHDQTGFELLRLRFES
jgi:putative acetyltransferase